MTTNEFNSHRCTRFITKIMVDRMRQANYNKLTVYIYLKHQHLHCQIDTDCFTLHSPIYSHLSSAHSWHTLRWSLT